VAEFDWHAYGVVIGSEYRKKVVASMVEGPRTPSQLSKEIGVHRNHVSLSLKELTEVGVVECLTPELRKGRLFGLTKLGREISSKL
jgi:predicted transcriptional regulator